MEMSESLQNKLYVKLQELISIQSEGEWDDLLIQKDARKFTAELMPIFSAIEADELATARKVAFQEAIHAIEHEFLEDPIDSVDDIAYDRAVSDCLKAVAAIAAKEKA
jgi:hypothetical protein